MATVTIDPAGTSMDTSTAALAPQITGLYAGAAIPAMTPCYIKAADGKAYPTNATTLGNEAARFAGICPVTRAIGQPVTLFGLGTRFHYTATAVLTPGALYFLSATAGLIDTAATTGDTLGHFQAIDDTDLRVVAAI